MIGFHGLLQSRRLRPVPTYLVRLTLAPSPASEDESLVVALLQEHGSLPRLALVETLVRRMLRNDHHAAAVDAGLWGRVLYEHQATRLLAAMEGRVIVTDTPMLAAA